MPDVSFWTAATITASVGAASGAIATPLLGAIGIDGASVGAGLLGCIAVQVFMPPEKIELWRISTTAVGSMIVASIGAPFGVPVLLSLAHLVSGNVQVTPEHANAASAAIIGGFAKPIVLAVKSWIGARSEAAPKGDL